MGSKKRNLKNLLINPRFQGIIILYSVVLSFLLISIQFLALKFFFNKYINEGFSLGLKQDHPFFRFIQEQERYMNYVFLGMSLFLIVITVTSGLILSHRIAGPIHRLKGYFKSLSEGAEHDLAFRKGDFFQDVPPVINDGLSKVRVKVEKVS